MERLLDQVGTPSSRSVPSKMSSQSCETEPHRRMHERKAVLEDASADISDESEDSEEDAAHETPHSENLRYRPKCDFSQEKVTKSLKNESSSPPKKDNTANGEQSRKDGCYQYLVMLAIGVLLVVSFIFIIKSDGSFDTNPITYDENFLRHLKLISSNFPSQEKRLFLTFSAGIEKTSRGEGPSTFLLLHNDVKTGESLLKQVTNATKGFFKISSDPLWLEGSKIKHELSHEPSRLTDYRYEIENRIVTVVTELEQIPGHIARYFHSFCDTYNPMVKRAVYFFLLKDGAVGSNYNHPAKTAEDSLKKIWSSELSDEILLPLIVRMTENVLELNS